MAPDQRHPPQRRQMVGVRLSGAAPKLAVTEQAGDADAVILAAQSRPRLGVLAGLKARLLAGAEASVLRFGEREHDRRGDRGALGLVERLAELVGEPAVCADREREREILAALVAAGLLLVARLPLGR